MLSEMGQANKGKYHMFQLTRGIQGDLKEVENRVAVTKV
jgi:hypothetical protein